MNGLFHETLQSVDDETRTFSYTIDDGPDPISKETMSGYTGVVSVRPFTGDGTAFVEWSSSWEDGSGIAAFCNPIYRRC